MGEGAGCASGLRPRATDMTRRTMLSTGAIAEEEPRQFPFSAKDFRYLAALVHERTGIVLASHKMNLVYARLTRRLRALRLTSYGEYCRLLQSEAGAEEIGFLINAITTNLTKFFREGHHFDHLREVLRRSHPPAPGGGRRRLRIWSAGCSSGEEPYSIAMTVVDAIADLAQWDARILATDLDSSVLDVAEAGAYRGEAVAGLPKPLRLRHFERDAGTDQWMVAAAVRRLVAFRQLNLLDSWPMRGPFDAIFCRNVMIYFDAAAKNDLVRRFAALLKPCGWLYVGHSESLLHHQSMFAVRGRTIYQKVAS